MGGSAMCMPANPRGQRSRSNGLWLPRANAPYAPSGVQPGWSEPPRGMGGNIGPWAGRLGLAKVARNARLVLRRGRAGVRPEPLPGPRLRRADRARWGPTTLGDAWFPPHGAPPQPGRWATGALSYRQCPQGGANRWPAAEAAGESAVLNGTALYQLVGGCQLRRQIEPSGGGCWSSIRACIERKSLMRGATSRSQMSSTS